MKGGSLSECKYVQHKYVQVYTSMYKFKVYSAPKHHGWPQTCIYKTGVNLTVQDLLRQDEKIQGLYFNITEMKLSVTLLFSVQIMSYLGASDMPLKGIGDLSFFKSNLPEGL